MGSLQFELKGLEKLQKKLQKVAKMEEIERIVEKNGEDMQKKAVNNASKFRGHYKRRAKIGDLSAQQERLNGLSLLTVER